ncbi:MAG: hypothetical protein A3F73_12140 [Gallionellales bacterium RIFCSPLOWO2_12_FULL_59_22]|nr:MAG: hypothetical protein A3H99_01445 [Gallionellales bacterium RIFCSPLOWO2_02_FULL_59_110]OGT12213.1 MAG: hypothetical protein A3F73_12140 [Gallionellales bacterium RIFCSPLOWO2_12_FULL_59_22]
MSVPALHRFPLALAVLAAGVGQAWADGLLDDWQLNGSNTLRLETYRVNGDPLAGPYRFTGGQHYDEFNVNMSRRLSPYDMVRAQFYGVANNSDYRAPDLGFVPERVNVMRENGDSAIPYRFEAGDYFAYFSFRTLQRSLKGAQLELQPAPGSSVLLVSGANQPSWRHAQAGDDWTNGISWLAESGAQTRFSANLLHNSRQADPVLGKPDRNQTVASVTGDHAWQWSAQRLRLEGEFAGLRGDHDGSAGASGAITPASGQDRNGAGAFLQFTGQAATDPLDYRLRFERYDRDFRPAGAVIAPDRRSGEAHLGWRFADGLALRARAQQFIDALESGNQLRNNTYGANLAGPFFAGSISGLSGSVDMFHQDFKKQDATVDRAIWNLNANFAKPLPGNWAGNFGLFRQQVEERVAGANEVRSTQLQLGATHAFNAGGWAGSFTPGITLRRVSGGASAVEEFSPALAFALNRNAHGVSASYNYQKLQHDLAALATVEVNALRLDYRYTAGADIFGIEASAYDRDVTIGQFNDTYRLSLFWTHAFDKPARGAVRPAAIAAADTQGMLPRDIGALAAVEPGAGFDAALKRLDESGFRGSVRQGNMVVFEQRLLDGIEQRQRFALVGEAGRVSLVGLSINIDDPNNTQAIAQTYERVRKALLDRFGRPEFTFEEGEIAPTFVADLNAGRVIRVMEWQLENGRLRLGIPRRLDGQARIEIQHAARFGTPRDALWSIEELR